MFVIFLPKLQVVSVSFSDYLQSFASVILHYTSGYNRKSSRCQKIVHKHTTDDDKCHGWLDRDGD